MKRSYRIVSIIIITVILIGLMIFLSTKSDRSTEVNKTSDTKTFISSAEEVKEIHINKEITLKKSNEQWYADDLEREADQTKINNAATTILSIKGKETDKSLESAGLTTPQVEMELVVADKDENTFISIGDISEDNLYYYVSLSGEDIAYQVDATIIQSIPLSKYELTDNRILEVTPESVSEISIYNGIQTIELKPESPYAEEEVRTNLSGWYMHQPYNGIHSVKYNMMSEMIYGIEQLEMIEMVEENVKDLSQYGLEDVDFSISFKGGEKEEKLLIGDPSNDHAYYAMVQDERNVITISKEVLNLYSYQAFDIVEKFVKILALDVVKTLEINVPGNSIVINVIHSKQHKDEENKKHSFKIDDIAIEDGAFRDLYKIIAGLSFDKEVSDATYEEPEATMCYTIVTKADKEKEVLIEFVHYDEENYAVFIEKNADFLINKESLDTMIDQIVDLKNES